MKKMMILLALFAVGMATMAFKSPNNSRVETEVCFMKISLTEVSDGWGQWSQTSCYRGIYFRVKKGDFNVYSKEYFWYVQFKNTYSRRVSIAYTLTNQRTSSSNVDLDHGMSLSAGDYKTSSYFLIDESSEVNVWLKIHYGDYKYLNCDK